MVWALFLRLEIWLVFHFFAFVLCAKFWSYCLFSWVLSSSLHPQWAARNISVFSSSFEFPLPQASSMLASKLPHLIQITFEPVLSILLIFYYASLFPAFYLTLSWGALVSISSTSCFVFCPFQPLGKKKITWRYLFYIFTQCSQSCLIFILLFLVFRVQWFSHILDSFVCHVLPCMCYMMLLLQLFTAFNQPKWGLGKS